MSIHFRCSIDTPETFFLSAIGKCFQKSVWVFLDIQIPQFFGQLKWEDANKKPSTWGTMVQYAMKGETLERRRHPKPVFGMFAEVSSNRWIPFPREIMGVSPMEPSFYWDFSHWNLGSPPLRVAEDLLANYVAQMGEPSLAP